MTALSFATLPTPARSPFFRPSQNLSHAGRVPASSIVIRCSRVGFWSLLASLFLSLPLSCAMPFHVVMANENYGAQGQLVHFQPNGNKIRTWKFWV